MSRIISTSSPRMPRARRKSALGMLAAPLLAGSALLLSAPALLANDYKVGDIVIESPWSRATPNGASVGAGYGGLKNAGGTDDRLISASTPVAGRVEIHETVMQDGVMAMRPLTEGLMIPAGGAVKLKPGSYHIMFMQLKQPLKEGETVDATLTFEKAGSVPVRFEVKSLGAGAGSHSGH